MTAIVADLCPVCHDVFEKDSEKFYWHLKCHLAKIELQQVEPITHSPTYKLDKK